MTNWFQPYKGYITEPEIELMKAADLVLHSNQEDGAFPEKVTAFILALSLHTRTALMARAIHLLLDANGKRDSGGRVRAEHHPQTAELGGRSTGDPSRADCSGRDLLSSSSNPEVS
jgi:hypothetical protein